MSRLIINAVLLLIVQEIYFVATATDQETCESDREMEKKCRIHNYKTVKPLLDYFRQVRNELEDKEIKENKLNELSSDLMKKYHEIVRIHEKFIKEAALLDEYKNKLLKGENDLQLCKNRVYKFESETNLQQNVIVKLKGEIAEKSTKLENCEIQYKNLNSSLFEKDENIKRLSENIQNNTEHQKTLEVQLEKSKTKLIKQDKDIQLCQSEIDTLNKTLLNTLIPTSCSPYGDSEVHPLNVSGIGFFDVLCDSQLAGPGWIVIQQRVGGNEDFNRDWATYRKGFGSYKSDFFMGLEKIHRITSLQRHELYIHLVAVNGSTYNARYDDFKISDEDSGYKLSLGKFSGTIIKDAMRYAKNTKFSTFDSENDTHLTYNCADYYKSGWWYKSCYNCNLNALYGPNLNWWGNDYITIKEAKMLIRPKEAIKK
ncbi:angiopoietin-related protein 7-like isoform X2 [Drosophila sulfurigaster albostrigata]|uniref:angiopoietin-related protein 7-like isoform X2 n=1 Tax=Drosophila sulfurigaster albostrigata TaxID=89887 RepID=UPI002D21C97B|nr:angiopoietin-related protein 7-like isoform X2 [Drosophila sulfurigaster albostrigata]